jgi:hypothetical protein
MYGCVAELFVIGDLLLEGNISAMDSPPQLDVKKLGQLGIFARHPKDPIPS